MNKKGYNMIGLSEEEAQKMLMVNSEKSLKKITKETELLTSQAAVNDMKISLQEVEDFLREISSFKTPKITKKELKTYLQWFPKKYSTKEINFLMNGESEMDANTLHELLTTTSIEPFDPVEEAFKLLDVENKGFLTVETFKTIFKNLNFGEITPSDEDIFKEVADFDGDGVINLDDFRKILSQSPEYAERMGLRGMDEENMMEGEMDMDDMDGMDDMEDDMAEDD